MKIYVDENIPSRTVHALRELGHEVFDHRGALWHYNRSASSAKS
ncbi:MAG: DUF5615 family PIN-like protein [Bacillota bacterium]